jgi:esterase/lipase superfamily enzyme
MAAQVPPRYVQPLPPHPDSDNPLRVNPLRRPIRTPRRGDLPAELMPNAAEAAPHTATAEPDRVVMQPSGPEVLPPAPTPPEGPAEGAVDPLTLPPEARPPWPVVPAPFGPGSSPRFARGDREPFEAAARPPWEPATREPAAAAAEPNRVETEPRAMNRETPEAAEVLPESAAPLEIAPPAEDGQAGTARQPEERDKDKDENFHRVTVYYGTDRANLSEIERSQREYLIWLRWSGVAVAGTLGLGVLSLRFRRGYFLKFLLVACLLSSVGLGGWSVVRWLQAVPLELQPQYAYGSAPGALKYGTCDVSIPKTHERGELESPSLIWGEFQPDPEKHVKVLDTVELGEAAFYDRLRDCVAGSKKKQAFVFIHGYNVSFDDAVRRTAQLAFDLEFDGAPICYSWPSRANTFLYGSDEESVRLTEDHLEIFLKGIQEQSGAEKIHLIAHSMGNRCLTAVLKSMARDLESDEPPFDEVVLTAPDVHATIFRRRAPDVVRMSRHVTLYASSNDQALAMSKEYHDFPRAGETGKNSIVVVPGVDTIDVSSVDTSLVGHSYYGDNTSVLSDLFHLIQFGHPATHRAWLQPKPFEDSRYWIFLKERIGQRATTDSR